jgi:hypothetical protein
VELKKYSEAVAEVESSLRADGATAATRYHAAVVHARLARALSQPWLASVLLPGRDSRAEKDASRAVGLLREAHQASLFKDARWHAALKQDKNLDPLRQRADFRKLLADVEAAR